MVDLGRPIGGRFLDRGGAALNARHPDFAGRLQSAIDAHILEGGPPVLAPGRWLVDAPITIPADPVTAEPWGFLRLLGSGAQYTTAYVHEGHTYGTIIERAPGYTGPLFSLNAARAVEFHDMLINGGGVGIGMHVDNANVRINFRNVFFLNHEVAVKLGDRNRALPHFNDDTIHFDGCHFDQVGTAVLSEGNAVYMVTFFRTDFYTLVARGVVALHHPGYAAGATFYFDKCMSFCTDALARIGNNVKGPLTFRDCHFEQPAGSRLIDTGEEEGWLLPTAVIDGCTINNGHAEGDEVIRYIGNGNLRIVGCESKQPYFRLRAGGSAGTTVTLEDNHWLYRPTFRDQHGGTAHQFEQRNERFVLEPGDVGTLADPRVVVHRRGGRDVRGARGRVQLAAAPGTAVRDAQVQDSASRIVLTPANRWAGTLLQGRGLYVDGIDRGTFSIRTGDGTPATGNELFDYVVVN